jgi:hypothetical protein
MIATVPLALLFVFLILLLNDRAAHRAARA